MKRREFIVALGGAAAWPLAAKAQQPAKIRRIGYLAPAAPGRPWTSGFPDGLRDLGYVEGQNLAIEWRFANGKMELLPAMAAELVQLNLEVIVATTALAGIPVQRATKTIPIVVIASHGGVELGLYASLARPGGNVTGIDSLSESLDAKRIEIFRLLLPQLSRLVVLYNPEYPGTRAHLASIDVAAKKFGIAVRPVEFLSGSAIENALAEILRDRPDGVLSISDPLTETFRDQITAFGTSNKIPMAGEVSGNVQIGQLFSYGASLYAIWRRGAYYVDRILKGAKPGDLPVEQPTSFELVINRKTARDLGLIVPDSLLATADALID